MQTTERSSASPREAVEDLAADGVVYAEVRFAPELHQHGGLPLEAVVEAVTSGFRRGEADGRDTGGHTIVVNAICCAMRTEHRSLEIAQLVDRLRAWSTTRSWRSTWPAPRPGGRRRSTPRRSRSPGRAHLNITIHASEPPDLELISDALAHGAHRIGHGVRLAADTHVGDDGELVLGPLAQYVLDHQIHLEMAPTCNVQIGAVPSGGRPPDRTVPPGGVNVGSTPTTG
jgi:adenosine deaminase